MRTLLLNTKPGLLDWLRSVRMLWYEAERRHGLRVLDAADVEPDELGRRVGRELLVGKGMPWRAVVLASDDDPELRKRLEKLETLDRAYGKSGPHRIVILGSPPRLTRRTDPQGRDIGGSIETGYDDLTTSGHIVVRAVDPGIGDATLERVRYALFLLAMTTDELDGGPDGTNPSLPGEWHLEPARGHPSIVLRAEDHGGAPSFRSVIAQYRARLEQALEALDDRQPEEEVRLLGDDGAQRVAKAAAELVADVPGTLPGFWERTAEASGRGRSPPPLPNGFFQASDWERWESWRRSVDDGMKEMAHDVRVSARRALEDTLRRAQSSLGDGDAALHAPEGLTLSLPEVRRRLASEAASKSEVSRSLGSEDSTLDEVPPAKWRKVERVLNAALQKRPSRAQVLVSAGLGFAALLPAALLQFDVSTRVVSSTIVLAFVILASLWIRRSVVGEIALAHEACRSEASAWLGRVRGLRTDIVKRLRRDVQTWARQHDVRELEKAEASLEARMAPYEYHRASLGQHARDAVSILESLPEHQEQLPRSASHAEPPLPDEPESANAVYSPAWRDGHLEDPPIVELDGAPVELQRGDLAGLRSIALVRCHPSEGSRT